MDEGVIKFKLEHTATGPLPEGDLVEIILWRQWMYARGLIGVIETPQGPIGYGNISVRHTHGRHPQEFIVSGSQTGDLTELDKSHFALVEAAYPEENRLVSRGPIKPSSESASENCAIVCHAFLNSVVKPLHHFRFYHKNFSWFF